MHLWRTRWLSTLAANLAVAAFGQVMFDAGAANESAWQRAMREGPTDWRHAPPWRPGCGHPAPGFDEGRK